jgi:hypothetical protein
MPSLILKNKIKKNPCAPFLFLDTNSKRKKLQIPIKDPIMALLQKNRRHVLFSLFLCVFSFELLANYDHLLFFEKSFRTHLQKENKRLVLVTSGWSQGTVEKIQKKKNQEGQKRAFAPAYLLAAKIHKDMGKVRIFYLTTAPIEESYRRYLYRMATGDGTFEGFNRFEKESFEIVSFDGTEEIFGQTNTKKWADLKNRLDAMGAREINQILGMTAHATGQTIEEMAARLGIPFLGNPSHMGFVGQKSTGRQLYRDLEIPHARGSYIPAKTPLDLAADINGVFETTGAKKVIVKIDRSAAGDGNRTLRREDCGSLEDLLGQIALFPPNYMARLEREGAIVEEFLEGGDRVTSPATMTFILGENKVIPHHNYNQILGGADLQEYQGSSGPLADTALEKSIVLDYAQKVTTHLATLGVRGHVGMDFLVLHSGEHPRVYGIENNVRQTGTLYAYTSSLILTNNLPKKYLKSFDDLVIPKLNRKKARDEFVGLFLNWLDQRPYRFRPERGRGIFIHSPTFRLGRIGIASIGRTEEESNQMIEKFQIDLKKFLTEQPFQSPSGQKNPSRDFL